MPEPTQLKAVPNAVQRATGPNPQQMQHTINVLNGVLEVTKQQRGNALDVCAQLNVDISMLRGEIQRLNGVVEEGQAALERAQATIKEYEDAVAPGSATAAAGTDEVSKSAKPASKRAVEPDPPAGNAE